MTKQWDYQIRVYLSDAFAKAARTNSADPALKPFSDVLNAHDAKAVNQHDAFAGYVAEAEANGIENYPLYHWTKKTVDNPEKEAKYSKAFTLYVSGQETYAKDKAEALHEALAPLVGKGIVDSLHKYDTNPANNPQPRRPQ